MVTKACSWCKKESNAFLFFLKPRGWIKHRTPDEIDMLFCSLACFKTFTGAELALRPKQAEKPVEAQEEQLITTLAQ